MQLEPGERTPPVLGRLRAAACLLLAAGTPTVARAADGATPQWQVETTALLYGESARAKVVEPMARLSRIFSNGQTLGAQFSLDVITGASPTGARPASGVQTTTTPSGRTVTVSAGELPMTSFHDVRKGLDLDWSAPIGTLLKAETAGHYSNERDYLSKGATEKLSLDVLHRMMTVTVGAGFNRDRVSPIGGTPVGLASGGTFTGVGANDKDVTSGLLGVSRVLTRRWLAAVNVSGSFEKGYLTEPYKVISVLDPTSGAAVDHLTEKRPDSRRRMNVMANSVYHLKRDVAYASYRYYWDDWGLRSHTLDFRYRGELPGGNFLQPHVRVYTQNSADFFTLGLVSGTPLPSFASSDQRLSSFNSMTLGLTYGFHVTGAPGEFTMRAEYIRQFGHVRLGSGEGEENASSSPDPFPPLDIGTITAGYTISF
jgi:hypothetical protein